MSNDNKLQHKVLAELSWEPSVTAAHIGVTANDGIVTLTGHVENFAQKHAAQKAAGRVKGVKAVADEIEVKLPIGETRADDELAAAAIDRLWWDVSVPRDAFKVLVEKGWITLTGQADWHFQKTAAEQDVRRLFGVTGVSNEITIKPRASATSIGDSITLALDRSWFLEPNVISVSADGGAVRLSGTVHSLQDRLLAGATAWAALGATDVTNELRVV